MAESSQERELQSMFSRLEDSEKRKPYFAKHVLFVMIQYVACSRPARVTYSGFSKWIKFVKVNVRRGENR